MAREDPGAGYRRLVLEAARMSLSAVAFGLPAAAAIVVAGRASGLG